MLLPFPVVVRDHLLADRLEAAQSAISIHQSWLHPVLAAPGVAATLEGLRRLPARVYCHPAQQWASCLRGCAISLLLHPGGWTILRPRGPRLRRRPSVNA